MKELRERYGLSRAELSRLLSIPVRTLEDWESGKRKAPEYVLKLIEYWLCKEYD